MNIEPNNDGWSFDESVGWKLIHNDIDVIFFEETDKAISTQEKLFAGTKEECEAEIARLGLTWASVPVDAPSVPIEVQVEELLTQVSEESEEP